MSTELYIPAPRPRYNRTNGQFLKGHVPANKGKRWEEYMTEEAMQRASRGWENLEKYRPTYRHDTAGRCRKQVVAVTDDGRFRVFSYLGAAAKWIGGNRENVGRCCRENASRRVKQHSWSPGKPKGTSTVNTDHRYLGVRWYFESDKIWITKINQTS